MASSARPSQRLRRSSAAALASIPRGSRASASFARTTRWQYASVSGSAACAGVGGGGCGGAGAGDVAASSSGGAGGGGGGGGLPFPPASFRSDAFAGFSSASDAERKSWSFSGVMDARQVAVYEVDGAGIEEARA